MLEFLGDLFGTNDSKSLFLLDPEKAVESAKLKFVCVTLLKCYGIPDKGEQAEQPDPKDVGGAGTIPKDCGRNSGPPLRRTAVTKELKTRLRKVEWLPG